MQFFTLLAIDQLGYSFNIFFKKGKNQQNQQQPKNNPKQKPNQKKSK